MESMSATPDDPPEKVLDWVMLGGIILGAIPFLVANGVVYAHRKRKYFQASGWELILGMSGAAVIWIMSALVVNEHFKRERVKLFAYCALWTFWLQLTLGICLWLTFMALRLHSLYTVCTSGKPPNRVRVWLVYVPVLLAPAVSFAVLVTVKHISRHPCDMPGKCIIDHVGWKLSSFLVLPLLYFSMILILVFRLRNQSDYLLQTERQHTKDYAVMGFVLYLLTGTTYFSSRQNNVEGRCFLTFCVCSVTFVHFWVHAGWPVYLCLFKPPEEMDKYEENLRRHGAICLRRYPNEPRAEAEGSQIPEYCTVEGEEAIFQAIATEQTRKEDLKTKKEQLHRRISQVRARIEELKQQKTVILPHASQSFPVVRNKEKLDESSQMTRHLSLELSAMSNPNSSHVP